MSELKAVPCRGCGAPIIWTISPTGAKLCLDAKAPVYMVQTEAGGAVRAVRCVTHYVSHFNTCPKASEFSGRGKAGRAPLEPTERGDG